MLHRNMQFQLVQKRLTGSEYKRSLGRLSVLKIWKFFFLVFLARESDEELPAQKTPKTPLNDLMKISTVFLQSEAMQLERSSGRVEKMFREKWWVRDPSAPDVSRDQENTSPAAPGPEDPPGLSNVLRPRSGDTDLGNPHPCTPFTLRIEPARPKRRA